MNNYKGHILVPGLPKCGTSSIYNYFIQHPNIVAPKYKELNYLGKTDYTNKVYKQKLNAHKLTILNKSCYSLDVSPSYSHRDTDVVLKNVKIFDVDTHVFIMLRNIPDRLYSNFNMNKKQRHINNNTDFDTYWKTYIKNSMQQKLLDYREILIKWHNIFPNMRIIYFQEFIQDPLNTMNKIFQLLGIPTMNENAIDLAPIVPYSKNNKVNDYREMSTHTKQLITQYFANDIKNYKAYIKDNNLKI